MVTSEADMTYRCPSKQRFFCSLNCKFTRCTHYTVLNATSHFIQQNSV